MHTASIAHHSNLNKLLKLVMILSAFAVGAMLASCGGTSPDLVRQPQPTPTPAPPPVATPYPTPKPMPKAVNEAAVVPVEVKFAPKVDVLFVIDTSESMDSHIKELYENVNRFVKSFDPTQTLDFHIGVVTVWDTERFGFDKVVKNPWPLGKLRSLRDPNKFGQEIPGPQYVTRVPGWDSILKSTLKVAIEPRCTLDANGKSLRNSNGTCVADGGGPEFEDMFSPVRCALGLVTDPTDEIYKYCKGDQNGDFLRPDAHLAVIFLTDADDGSRTQTSQFVQEIQNLKAQSQKNVSLYGVLAVKDDNGARCKDVDPGLREVKWTTTTVNDVDPKTGKVRLDPKTKKPKTKTKRVQTITYLDPTKLLDVVEQSGNKAISLCANNYGDKLAAIGSKIESDSSTVESFIVKLEQVPQPSTLVVQYTIDQKVLALEPGPAPVGCWSYDVTNNALQIHGGCSTIRNLPGGKISVKFTPVDWERVGEGKVSTGL